MEQEGEANVEDQIKSSKRKRAKRDNGKKRIEKDESNEKERKIERQKDRDSYDPHW